MQVWKVLQAMWNYVDLTFDVFNTVFFASFGFVFPVYTKMSEFFKYLFPRATTSTPSKDCADRVHVSGKTSPLPTSSGNTAESRIGPLPSPPCLPCVC